jgi:hypothetical protein
MPALRRPQALLLAVLAFSVGISSQTERMQGSLGRIYVYANWESPERRWVDIACDDEVVAKVKTGRFVVINLPPGSHAVSERDGIPVLIEVRSGEQSFVRLDQEVDGQTVIPVLTKMGSTEAGREMVHLTYIDTAKVLSNSVPKQDPRDHMHPPKLKTRGDKE